MLALARLPAGLGDLATPGCGESGSMIIDVGCCNIATALLLANRSRSELCVKCGVDVALLWNLGRPSKNPAYRIFQTEYSGCLDISAHA